MAPDSGEAGGLFHGRAEWAAVVNRAGNLCAYAAATDIAGGIWTNTWRNGQKIGEEPVASGY